MFDIESPILAFPLEETHGKGVELGVISCHKSDNLFFATDLLVSSHVGGLPDFFLSVLIHP